MNKRTGKYVRCKKCKELVSNAANCANCAARAENPYAGTKPHSLSGKRGRPTLDLQEGNLEELS